MSKSIHGCARNRIDLSSNLDMGKHMAHIAGVSIRCLGTCVSSKKWMFLHRLEFFSPYLIVSSVQLVLRGDVKAGRHGPPDVGEGGRRVPGQGLRHHPGRLRALRAGGQQGLALHHQQDPVRRADQVQDRGPDLHGPPLPPQLLQAALPGHHAAHQARAQEGREGRGQIRFRRQCEWTILIHI